jgi:hypothetical protein
MVVREWAFANAADSQCDGIRQVTIPADCCEVIEVSPEIMATVEAEFGPPDPSIWCNWKDSSVPVDFRDDNECDCGVEKHHYHCTVCGGVWQIGCHTSQYESQLPFLTISKWLKENLDPCSESWRQ